MRSGLLRSGDILLNKDGAQTGKVGRYRGEFPAACINEHLFLMRSRVEICDPGFLYWSLRSPAVQRQIQQFVTGSAQPGLARGFSEGVRINLPSLAEQRRAARALDAVAEAITVLGQGISKMQRLRKGVLESTIATFEDRRLAARLSGLTSKIVDGVHHTPTYTDRGVPFLTVENLTRGTGISLDPVRYVSQRAHAEYRKRIEPLPGDVLVSKDGTLGVARLVPLGFPTASVFVSVAVLRPIVDAIEPAFLRLFFDSDTFEKQLATQSAGTGLKHIHLEHFREFEIPGLTLDQQRIVVERVAAIDRAIHEKDRRLRKLRTIETGLMTDLTGPRYAAEGVHE
jgi:type I restriction enzyme S subunit